MKWFSFWILLGFAFITVTPPPLFAQDMRQIAKEVEEKKAALLEKAEREAETAKIEAAESKARIVSDKTALRDAITSLKRQNQALHKENEAAGGRLKELVKQEEKLSAKLNDLDAVVRELVGTIRANARDIEGLLSQNLQSALAQNHRDLLKSITNQTKFPGMNDIRQMVDVLFDEIRRSGEVRIEKAPFVNRTGEETTGDVLTIGNFTAAYRIPNETGFLIYSDASQRLFALSKLPKSRVSNKINQYMDGKSDDVPVDISRGAAVRQLAHSLSLWEQIPKGGPIVWPIIGICVLAILILLERLVYLLRVNVDADKLMHQLNPLIAEKKWGACESLCEKYKNKPVSKVLLAGICFKDMGRQDMENALQEAILGEVPLLERFLSTLGMLAAIAPLLGLLGTVTGMINTFHVITFYGTGDPKMMSGGISEALVTTMLGLSVAIPIMLCHTLLNRRVENIIAQMEEKAVSFVNTVFKTRNGH
jgi:biopolymer transport protein ExbB